MTNENTQADTGSIEAIAAGSTTDTTLTETGRHRALTASDLETAETFTDEQAPRTGRHAAIAASFAQIWDLPAADAADTTPVVPASEPAWMRDMPEVDADAANEHPAFAAVIAASEDDHQPRVAHATTKRSRRTPILAGAATLALVLGGGAFVYGNAHKTVTIDVDGQVRTVSTFASSVDSLLSKEGIRLSAHDEVTPSTGSKLTNGADIVVRYGREVTVKVDGKESTVWVNALDAAEALDTLSARSSDVAIVASRSGNRPQLSLRLDTKGSVAVVADGKATVVSDASTLGYALTGAKITLGNQDTVEIVDASTNPVAATTKAKVAVVVHRVVTQNVTTTSAIPFETQTQDDANMLKGQSKVLQAGVDGVQTLVESVTTVDGQETARTTVSNEVTTAPVPKIVAQGTKKAPVAAPPAGGQGSAPTDGVWAALARCESGGNPSIVSSNGLYHGLYQFTVGTWQSLGGTGLPSQASAEEQTRLAQALQARSGWGQWPACARSLGLLG